MKNKYDVILEKIKEAKHPVFLTGAGVSTHSGIADYRGENGIYKTDCKKYFSREFYEKNKKETEDFILKKLNIENSKPNVIHDWIASYSNARVITQNIDGLHELAGSNTINFHGTVNKKTKDLDIVFFGDDIKEKDYSESINAMTKADLVVIVGTTYEVNPFASLTLYCEPFVEFIYINLQPCNIKRFSIPLIDDIRNIAEHAMCLSIIKNHMKKDDEDYTETLESLKRDMY